MLAELIVDFLPWPGGRSKDSDHGAEVIGTLLSRPAVHPGNTTPPVGTNVARGNDDPSGCFPSWLC